MSCTKSHPCKNCPYRTDAPLAHWSEQHFIDLLRHDADIIGKAYDCHKQDGSPCRGFMMDQDRRGEPSIAYRLYRRNHEITNEYLDTLHSTVPLYGSIAEMAEANFPGITSRLDLSGVVTQEVIRDRFLQLEAQSKKTDSKNDA